MKPGFFKTAALLAACMFALSLAGCATNNRTGRQPDTGIRGENMNDTNPDGMGTRLFGKDNNRLPGTSPGTNRLNDRLNNGNRMGNGLGNGLDGDIDDLGNGMTERNNATRRGNQDARTRADNIRNGLSRNGDLSRVNVVTRGDDAIIGFVPAQKKAGRDIDRLKDTIVKRVRQLDPGIKNIYISEKEELSNEIEKLYNKIVPNEAGNRLDNEIKQLVKKIPFVAR